MFHSHANKTHFHKKGCALGLTLKVRVFRTRKWPIGIPPGPLSTARLLEVVTHLGDPLRSKLISLAAYPKSVQKLNLKEKIV